MAAKPDSFDFVVVGGGSAGLVVASRLSEDESVTVAVIEAGEDRTADENVRVPGKWIYNIGSELDWNFMSTEQPGLNSRRIGQPAGRTLGGSSAINGLAFIPPSAQVTNGWASLGNPKWTWETLRPYYQKSHTLTVPPEENVKHLGLKHLEVSEGCTGPIQAYYATQLEEPLAPAWAQTFQNLGWGAQGKPADAPADVRKVGIVSGGFSSPASIDAKTKERSYSASAHWQQAKSRPNVRLFTGTVVQRLLFDETAGQKNHIGGVEAISQGQPLTIIAKREVILAGGVFNTPKLLELSGIGDPARLSGLDIPARVPLPNVGQRMQDHLMTGISFEVNDDVNTLDSLRAKDPAAIAAAAEAYEQRREGPLTLGGINYFSFMPIDSDTDPELATLLQSLDAKGDKGLEAQYTYLKHVLQSRNHGSGGVYLSPRGTTYGASAKASDYGISSLPGKYITLGLSLLQPLSRGSTHISSADPSVAPTIDPGYLSNPVDVEVAALHLAFMEKLAATKPLADFIKPNGRRNASDARGDDRETARQWARRSVLSNWHGCGTCSMMSRELGGVVDQRLKVYDTTGLRIVDASVMPIIPMGNILASVYMVAERAADLIKEDHGLV